MLNKKKNGRWIFALFGTMVNRYRKTSVMKTTDHHMSMDVDMPFWMHSHPEFPSHIHHTPLKPSFDHFLPIPIGPCILLPPIIHYNFIVKCSRCLRTWNTARMALAEIPTSTPTTEAIIPQSRNPSCSKIPETSTGSSARGVCLPVLWTDQRNTIIMAQGEIPTSSTRLGLLQLWRRWLLSRTEQNQFSKDPTFDNHA